MNYFSHSLSEPVHLQYFSELISVFLIKLFYYIRILPYSHLELVILTECRKRMFELWERAYSLFLMRFLLNHFLLFLLSVVIVLKHSSHFGINVLFPVFFDLIVLELLIEVFYTLSHDILKVGFFNLEQL
jgi:hypothetical protein